MRTPPWLAAPDSDYLWVPSQLLATLYDSPTAIGLFTLIVRRWLASDTATVAMSDQDIQRYDPALCRGSIRAAIKRLVDGGWIQVTRHAGRKTQYCPAWGRSTNARLWSKMHPQLNRRRVRTVRLDRKLLDDYMGRLIPHAKAPALIERYGIRAHLTLADVGTYLLMQHTSHAVSATPALEMLDLCFQSEALAVPTTEETLAKMELSEQGARRVGIVKPPVHPRPASADLRPALFFVPGELARQLARQLARPATQAERGFSAAERAKTAVVKKGSLVTGIKGNKAKHDPPTPLNTTEQMQKKTLCGGEFSFLENGERLMSTDEGDTPNQRPNQPRRRRNIMSIPETPAAERLRALNVRPQTCIELADLPLDLINACIADGQARPAVRDLAAWTVSMARDARDHGWQVALDKRGARPTDDFWADPDAAIAKLTARFGLKDDAGSDTPEAPMEETPSTPPPLGGGDQQEDSVTDCPDWIAPARWQTLWRPLRDALYRSRLRGRTVIAADSWRQKQLDEEYKDEVTSLVIAASMRRSQP